MYITDTTFDQITAPNPYYTNFGSDLRRLEKIEVVIDDKGSECVISLGELRKMESTGDRH